MSFALLTGLELGAGEFFKLIYGENPLWKYSPQTSLLPFDGQICWENSLLFGFGGLVIIYILQPFFQHLLAGHDLRLIAFALLVFCSLDLLYSTINNQKFNKRINHFLTS
jgi:uncharacterized membrane protein